MRGKAVLGDERLYRGAVFRPYIGDDNVLVGGQAELPVMRFRDEAHASEERRAAGNVPQAPVLDKEGEVEAAVLASVQP